jgi:hypothetical protein
MVSNCDGFYKVVTNDQCDQIASEYSIPLPSLYNWSPAVNTDCSGLQASEIRLYRRGWSVSTDDYNGVEEFGQHSPVTPHRAHPPNS